MFQEKTTNHPLSKVVRDSENKILSPNRLLQVVNDVESLLALHSIFLEEDDEDIKLMYNFYDCPEEVVHHISSLTIKASANPSGNHHQEQSSFNGGAVASTSNGNSGQGHDNSGTASAMKHNPGIATDWTVEEQTILENGLTQYASVSSIIRYAKISMELPNKTVRDVALRARWMNKKEISKRRKEDHTRKNKDKREKVTESSSKSSQLHASGPGGHPYPLPAVPLDDEDGVSYKAIGGHIGELLEQNKELFQQISANFSSYQIQENINLFCQARDNLYKVMNNCSVNDAPEIMKQMPPLPVKLNEELATTLLSPMNHQKPS